MSTLNILSGGAAQGLVASLAPRFKAETGFEIAGDFGAVGAMAEKLRFGARADIVILTAALSGANANLYSASRMLFSLARRGCAPAPLGRLNAAGSPKLALVASSYGIVVAAVLEKWASQNAFVYILTGALFGLMLSWVVSLAAHISFRKRISSAQVAALPMRSPLGAWGSILGLTLITAALLKTWRDSRVSLLSGVSTLLILSAAYFFRSASKNKSLADKQ